MNRMIGGSLGVAVIGAVFQARAPEGAADPVAFVGAFTAAMWVATAVAFAGAVVAIALLRGRAESAPGTAEAEAPASPAGELATATR
jgi:hypothetical protein